MSFVPIDINSLQLNPFTAFDGDWALLSAGNESNFNTMTISWGALGTMWNKPVAIVFVRPQRYTKEFIDESDWFTVSFYPEKYRKALALFGSKSGRDSDKIKESGLTPYFINGTVAFNEARMIYVCKKLFGGQQLDPSKFIDADIISALYPKNDFHYFYFGEIIKVLVK